MRPRTLAKKINLHENRIWASGDIGTKRKYEITRVNVYGWLGVGVDGAFPFFSADGDIKRKY
jgi:hypothetical protein